MECAEIRVVVLSSLMAACGADSSAGPGIAGPETTIHISADAAPVLVVFRDAADGTWRPATRTSATTFEAVVRGTYMVTAVCDVGMASLGLKAHWQTFQIGQTLGDPPEITLACAALMAAPLHQVTGTMVQAGQASAGGVKQLSQTPSWSFQLPAFDGPYELYATTTDRIAIRRGIVAGDTMVTPAIDLTTEGAALSDVAFTLTNLEPDESAEILVGIDMDGGFAEFFRGESTDAKVAPSSVLVAADLQTVLVRARGTQSEGALTTQSERSLRRPFQVGGDTSMTLPDGIGALQWSLDNGNVSATWSSLPEGFSPSLDVGGATRDPGKDAFYSVSLSTRYLAETGAAGAAADLDIPSFQPAWRIDFTQEYTRDIESVALDNTTQAVIDVFQTVNQGTHAGLGRQVRPRGGQQRR